MNEYEELRTAWLSAGFVFYFFPHDHPENEPVQNFSCDPHSPRAHDTREWFDDTGDYNPHRGVCFAVVCHVLSFLAQRRDQLERSDGQSLLVGIQYHAVCLDYAPRLPAHLLYSRDKRRLGVSIWSRGCCAHPVYFFGYNDHRHDHWHRFDPGVIRPSDRMCMLRLSMRL